MVEALIKGETESGSERRDWTCAMYRRVNAYDEDDLAEASTRGIVEEICDAMDMTIDPVIWNQATAENKARMDALLERHKTPNPKYEAWIAKMTGKPIRTAGGP